MREKLKQIRDSVRDITINRCNRRKLTNQNFTLISSDCTGGMIYHDLKQKFCSPTINMYFDARDYIKFIKNIHDYLDEPMAELKEESQKEGYPVALLKDIKLHLVHYLSVENAQEKWNERKQRMNWDNCFYIMNDRNYCTINDMKEFDDFVVRGGRNGVLFTHKYHPELKTAFYIKGSEDKDFVDIIPQYVSLLHRRYDQFDWIEFLERIYK
ncbi:MAG: DUF1919 domain-containing protein [Butyrivibrio sp.]|nr:DUF1919 domain-containing protein [Butyrivibrio sp.]